MGSISTDEFFNNEDNKKFIKKLQEELTEMVLQEMKKYGKNPSEIILDDEDLQKLLKISKRTASSLREEGLINYSQPVPKGKVYYTFQDVLDYIASGRVERIMNKRKF